MRPEVQEIYEALVNAKSEYERLRARIIATEGYDVFRDRQREAFAQISAAVNTRMVP